VIWGMSVHSPVAAGRKKGARPRPSRNRGTAREKVGYIERCSPRKVLFSLQLIMQAPIRSSDPRAMLPAASNDANSTQMISLRSR
jgi:hypothetical protein